MVLQRHPLAGGSEAQRRRTSLDVAVVIRAVGLGHIHLSHGLAHVVDAVPPRGHALVDAVQTFSLLEAGDLVLGGEAADGCGGKGGGRGEKERTSVSDKSFRRRIPLLNNKEIKPCRDFPGVLTKRER